MRSLVRHTALAGALAALLAQPTAGAEPSHTRDRAALPDTPAPSSAGSDGFRLSYDVYKSGFRALSLDFEVTLDGDRYRTDARLESAGLIGLLFEWRLDAVSAGRLNTAAVEPRRHRFANSWRGEQRLVEIDYRGGVPAQVRAAPPYDYNPERAVAADLLPGAVDPMSAVTAIVLENTRGELCRPTTAVYDGRRRYDAELTPLGRRELTASRYAPFAGPADGCHLTFRRIAGFKPDDDRMKKMSVDIWLADVGTGIGKIPVRLELNTPWGVGFAHLARARRNDGTLIFGDPDGAD